MPDLHHLDEGVDENVGDVLELHLAIFDGGDGGVVGEKQIAQKSQTPRQRG